MPWGERAISERSREYHATSTWTACVHDVALGELDMCWADFWITVERRRLTSWTASIKVEKFYLVLPEAREAGGVAHSLRKVFAPFSPGLWIALFAILASVGVALELDSSPVASRRELAKRLPRAMLRGFQGWFTGEVRTEETTTGSWVLQCALGLTVLVMTAAYLAGVTVTLLQEAKSEIKSMDDAIAHPAGYTFCAGDHRRPHDAVPAAQGRVAAGEDRAGRDRLRADGRRSARGGCRPPSSPRATGACVRACLPACAPRWRALPHRRRSHALVRACVRACVLASSVCVSMRVW